MNIKTINKIREKMATELLPEQLKRLEEVLYEEFNVAKSKTYDNQDLIKQFLSTKRIEGCSKRTEDYYYSTLNFFEKCIECNVCLADTNTIREYLINYQKNSIIEPEKSCNYRYFIFFRY